MKVTWKSLAPIFADVVISPWNLLVGGVLIQHLSFLQAFLSISIGYSILSIVFILYGGLGFKTRKESSKLLSAVFGSKVVKYIIPLILAFGQMGWGAINMDLGGRSFANLFSFPWFVGIGLYAGVLILMAMLNLFRLGITKLFISLSSLALMMYLFIMKVHGVTLTEVVGYQPIMHNSLFWGVSIVVASLISFATVTPDFFKSAKRKKDVVYATWFGLFPGVLVALLGCFFFFDQKSLDLIPLLSVGALSLFPNVFNMITNTDGSIAIYTPGLKFENIFSINLKKGIILSGIGSFLLALTQISKYLPIWLNVLSILFPAFIGICFAAFLFQQITPKVFVKVSVIAAFFVSTVFAVTLARFFPPVLISLLIPLFVFAFSLGYKNLSILLI